MTKAKTLIVTFIRKLYSYIITKYEIRIDQNILWMEVPTICKSRKDKDEIILTAIEHLEQTIKINKL